MLAQPLTTLATQPVGMESLLQMNNVTTTSLILMAVTQPASSSMGSPAQLVHLFVPRPAEMGSKLRMSNATITTPHPMTGALLCALSKQMDTAPILPIFQVFATFAATGSGGRLKDAMTASKEMRSDVTQTA